MPYIINRPRSLGTSLLAVGLSLLAVASPAAASTQSCPTPHTSEVFAPLGDTSMYMPVLGGTFENGLGSWTLKGASVVYGNEPWFVDSPSDAHSLDIAAKGSALSGLVCMSNQLPTWRFFALSPTGSTAGSLTITVRWSASNGISGKGTSVLSAANYRSWAATPALPLGSQLPAGVTVKTKLEFDASSAGNWQIDDLFVDPYAK